jgi:hypothetical protein
MRKRRRPTRLAEAPMPVLQKHADESQCATPLARMPRTKGNGRRATLPLESNPYLRPKGAGYPGMPGESGREPCYGLSSHGERLPPVPPWWGPRLGTQHQGRGPPCQVMTAMKTARHREPLDWPPPRGRHPVAQMRVKLERVEIMVPRRKFRLARFGLILLGALAVTVWIMALLAILLILIPFLSWRHRKRWGDRAARRDDDLLGAPSPEGSQPRRISAPWHHRYVGKADGPGRASNPCARRSARSRAR